MKHQPIKVEKYSHSKTLVAILSNPQSTRNQSVMSKVRRTVEDAKNAFHFELDDIGSIPHALRMFAAVNPCMIVINGGDGTIQATLSSIFNDKPFEDVPPIAILPGGKTNMIAADLGYKGKPVQLLRRLLSLAEQGRVDESLREHKVIELDVGDGQPPRYGMFFGGAAVVNSICYCRDHIYPMKMPNFVSHGIAIPIALFKIIFNGKNPASELYTWPANIHIRGGGILHGQYFWIVITTLDRLLFGLKPYGREGKGGLKFSAVDFRYRALFNAIKGLITGRFGRASLDGVHTRTADEIRIEGCNHVTLDGEIYEPPEGKPVVLRGDKSLTFISFR